MRRRRVQFENRDSGQCQHDDTTCSYGECALLATIGSDRWQRQLHVDFDHSGGGILPQLIGTLDWYAYQYDVSLVSGESRGQHGQQQLRDLDANSDGESRTGEHQHDDDLPAATVNAPYSQQLAATGGSGSYTWTLTTAVTGFSLSSSGLLTGTPTSTTSLSFQVKATDSANSSNFGTSTLTLAVSPGTLLITTTALPNGLINGAYSFTLQSTGGVAPFTWSLTGGTSLPPGLNLDGPTGAITGTPTTTGVFNVTFQVMDSGSPQQTNTKTLSLTIPQLSITTNSLLNPMVGESYNQTLHYTDVNGTLPLTWSVSSGTLPTGLSLDPSTGAITRNTFASRNQQFYRATGGFEYSSTDGHSSPDLDGNAVGRLRNRK